MNRKDAFFIVYMIVWLMGAVVMIVFGAFLKMFSLDYGFLYSMTMIFGMTIFAVLLYSNRKFNHWMFKECKTYAYIVSKRFDDDVEEKIVEIVKKV